MGGLSHALSLSSVGGVVNLLAGADPFPYRYFLPCDIFGEILSALIPLSLGYAFGASWEAVGDVLGSFSVFALALLVAIVLAFYLLGAVRRSKSEAVGEAGESAAVQTRSIGAPVAESPTRRSGDLPLS